MNEEITEISCKIISAVGGAKSSFVEAIEESKLGNFDKAKQLIAAGKEEYKAGHHAHAKLLEKFANGENVNVDILLVHAECQMMSAEDFLILAQNFLDFGEKLYRN